MSPLTPAQRLQETYQILEGLKPAVEFEVSIYSDVKLRMRGSNHADVPLDTVDFGFEAVGDARQAIGQILTDPANLEPCQFIFWSLADLHHYVVHLKSSA
jgi:hypothetical protein